jgi:DNA-binding NarL/FixJ family response regulator
MSTPAAAQAAERPTGPPRVVLVDDHGLFRSGVRAELGTRVEVIGEADDVAPAVELIGRLVPDVVLLDVHLPGGGGQAVITEVKKEHPDIRFLALSASDAPEDVIAVIRAGARGYVTKTISTNDLADAIRRVAELFISGKTVESHVSSVLRKLQLSSRHQLTRWATERRLA